MARRLAVLAACLAAGTPLAAQDRPALDVRLQDDGDGAPRAAVALRGLLRDERFVAAMQSGFPLYVALTVELRHQRSLWDRGVDRWVLEYVVVYDPVRERYELEDPDGREDIPDRAVLERRLERVYVVGLAPDREGRYHYGVSARARTLSDEDVDEVYAWLRGNGSGGDGHGRPGFLARTARKVLVQVAPLPRLDLEGRTDSFSWDR